MECTRCVRPHAWCYFNDGPVNVELNISLSAKGDETLLTSRFEAHPNGAFRLIFPLLLIMMRREEARNMQLLRQAVELRQSADDLSGVLLGACTRSHKRVQLRSNRAIAAVASSIFSVACAPPCAAASLTQWPR